MFFDENTERALLHRDTDRGLKFNNKPLIKAFAINPKYERKIGGSNHGVTSLKSSSDRLTDLFGEVPPLEDMAKLSKTEEKQLKAINKKYQCKSDPLHEVVLRPKKTPKTKAPKAPKVSTGAPKKKTKWMTSVADCYAHFKAKDPSYTYKQAMIDAKTYYRKRTFPFSKPS